MKRPNDKPVLIDLFCKAGGCTKGYQRAGFYVVGVDNEPQPNYCGDEFYQADAFNFLSEYWQEFDAIHASPPCQKYTGMRNITISRFGSCHTNHPDLIKPTRRALQAAGLPYIIENVQNSPLKTTAILCGASLGLKHVSRHRHFESNYLFFAPKCSCRKEEYTIGVYGQKPDGRRVSYKKNRLCRIARSLDEAQKLLQIDWMTWDEIKNAIPPAYTEYLGIQLMNICFSVAGHNKSLHWTSGDSPAQEQASPPHSPVSSTVLWHFAKGETMAPRTLAEPYQTLLYQIIETMLAGNGGKYPESHSDMNYCVRGLLKMYDVKRRPLAIEFPYADEAVEHGAQPIGYRAVDSDTTPIIESG